MQFDRNRCKSRQSRRAAIGREDAWCLKRTKDFHARGPDGHREELARDARKSPRCRRAPHTVDTRVQKMYVVRMRACGTRRRLKLDEPYILRRAVHGSIGIRHRVKSVSRCESGVFGWKKVERCGRLCMLGSLLPKCRRRLT